MKGKSGEVSTSSNCCFFAISRLYHVPKRLAMDSVTAKRFENVEFRLTSAEEKIVRQDKTLSAIRQLILTGMKLVAENQKG